jgi:UDP-N-acetylmuramoyl-L-alanyl-D-glutamate--2,6-diaminopimelate ligase
VIPAPPAWSRGLFTIGVTGTNGKTSTTRWTAACLARVSRPVAQTTTLGSLLDDEPFPCTRDLDGFLSTMRAGLDRGGRFAAIELTSEALARGFARAWPCAVGVFTNLTHDHLDSHGSPEHYLASKAQLFVNLPPGGAAVLNAADEASELLADVMPAGVRIVRYAVPSRGEARGEIDLRAVAVEVTWSGTRVTLEGRGALAHAPAAISTRAIGDIYAENAVAALAAALVAGVPPDEAARALAEAPVARGRFEPIVEAGANEGRGPRVVVDYAHTPDALARTLAIARGLCRGAVTVVFGAGGDRDRDKRAPMGSAASRADRIVLTSDNPRSEDPAAIAAAIRAGIDERATGGVVVELDRRDAIRVAILEAGEDDVVVVAGKGHETEQIVGARALPFDDAAEARAALRERSGGSSPSSSTSSR